MPEPLLRNIIDPSVNILIGAHNIMRYLHIRSVLTLYKWVDEFALPAIKRPDGKWMTSCTAIDSWVFLTADLDYQNRAFSRGTGVSPEEDLMRTAKFPEDHPRRKRAQNRYDQWVEGGKVPLPNGPKPYHRFGETPAPREVINIGTVVPTPYNPETDPAVDPDFQFKSGFPPSID